MRVIDFLIIVITAIASSLIMEGAFAGIKYDIFAGIFSAVLLLNYMNIAKGYDFKYISRVMSSIWKVGICWVLVFISISAIALTTGIRDDFYLKWYALYNATSMMILLLFHGIIAFHAKKKEANGEFVKNIVIVGVGELAEKFIKKVEDSHTKVNIIGIFDDREEEVFEGEFHGHAVKGNINALFEFVRNNNVDQIVLTISWIEEERILNIVNQIKILPVDIQLCPNMIGLVLGKRGVSNLGSVFLVNAFASPLSGWDLFLKEMEDKFLSAVILLFASPVMLLIAILIKLTSKGDVFFKQKRNGFNNKEFYVYKFRSMKIHDEEEGKIEQAKLGDNRVTRIGAILRKTSLDELPQFYNVLKGEMSIVGPRPHAVEHNHMYSERIKNYMERHKVKPGITGLAQIKGFRGETNTLDKMTGRIDHDIEYIENWSLFLDFIIMLKTLPCLGFVSKNAY